MQASANLLLGHPRHPTQGPPAHQAPNVHLGPTPPPGTTRRLSSTEDSLLRTLQGEGLTARGISRARTTRKAPRGEEPGGTGQQLGQAVVPPGPPEGAGPPAPGREGPLRLLRPLPLHCPHAQVTPEASPPQPGVQMRTPRGQQGGSCPWPPMGGPVPAAFCTPGSPAPHVPRLPPAQKDLREQKLFPRTRSTVVHRRGSKASRLSCNLTGPRGAPRLSTPSTGSPFLGRSLILAPGAQSGGHRTPDPVFPRPL